MQRVNVAILDGWFLTCLVGALGFGALAVVLHPDAGHRTLLPWDLAAVRSRFEDRWVLWNLVRTVAATGAFGCLLGALLANGRSGATH